MRKSWPEEIYQKVSINDLVLISLDRFKDPGERVLFDDLLKECFNLFPQKFNFPKNPKWPDARKLGRPIRGLRKKKLVVGNPKQGFSLTKIGRKKGLEAMNFLRQKKLKLK